VSTPYQRGAAFEHRVKGELEAAGYLVTRSPASKSPYDLVALHVREGLLPEWGHNGAPLLVQCKLRGVIPRVEREALVLLADLYGAEPVLAYTLQVRGMVHYKILVPGKAKDRDWVP
jgi:Holliday junction resolvase